MTRGLITRLCVEYARRSVGLMNRLRSDRSDAAKEGKTGLGQNVQGCFKAGEMLQGKSGAWPDLSSGGEGLNLTDREFNPRRGRNWMQQGEKSAFKLLAANF